MANILFLAATHGDEGFSIPLFQELEQEFPDISWLIANEEALKQGTRFVDCDLNRSASGDPSSTQYEMRRASELLKIAEQYDFVIDIHGATATSGIFAIVSNPTPSNLVFAACLPVSNVVIWEPANFERGPLTYFVKCGIGIECGPKDSKDIFEELRQVLGTIVKHGPLSKINDQQSWFSVYGQIPKEKEKNFPRLQDFQEVTQGGVTFYPLLIGQYDDIVCYKMLRVRTPHHGLSKLSPDQVLGILAEEIGRSKFRIKDF